MSSSFVGSNFHGGSSFVDDTTQEERLRHQDELFSEFFIPNDLEHQAPVDNFSLEPQDASEGSDEQSYLQDSKFQSLPSLTWCELTSRKPLS